MNGENTASFGAQRRKQGRQGWKAPRLLGVGERSGTECEGDVKIKPELQATGGAGDTARSRRGGGSSGHVTRPGPVPDRGSLLCFSEILHRK